MKALKINTNGFSLMELLITLAVLSILVSIAYPSYASFLLKARRAEGRAALVELMQQQERYMTQNNTYYRYTIDTSGITNPQNVPFKTFSGDSKDNSSYFIASRFCNPQNDENPPIKNCVLLAAKPVNPDPDAGELWLYSTGKKDCTGSNPSVCWN